MRKVFIGGNWKCNNTLSQTQGIVTSIIDNLEFDHDKVGKHYYNIDVVVSPVFLHLVTVLFTKKQQYVDVAAQNCSMNLFGAFTGEISVEQLKDINVKWVIIGHSERRTHFKESDEHIAKKVDLALKNGMKVIFCFGETLEERE
eukprot:GHVR01067972.1.p1 GENE.GHVR01067972.1~~GHVR01067972.1.p1  ORF type:complete len:144 (+),score=21.40 GHVR01067972.1:1198-1629(+)